MVKEMGQIRIVSEGKGKDTHIYDENGNDITNDLRPRRAEITIDVDDVNRVTLECLMPKVDIKTEATKKEICPYCGKEKEEE